MARDFANDVTSVRTFSADGVEYCEVVFPIKPEEYTNAKGTKLFALDSRVPAAGNDNLVRHFPTPFGQAYLTNLTVKSLDTKGTAQDLTKLTKDQLVKLLLQQQGLPVGDDAKDDVSDDVTDDVSDGVEAEVTFNNGRDRYMIAMSEEQIAALFGRGKTATTRINGVRDHIVATLGWLPAKAEKHAALLLKKAEKYIADTCIESRK